MISLNTVVHIKIIDRIAERDSDSGDVFDEKSSTCALIERNGGCRDKANGLDIKTS